MGEKQRTIGSGHREIIRIHLNTIRGRSFFQIHLQIHLLRTAGSWSRLARVFVVGVSQQSDFGRREDDGRAGAARCDRATGTGERIGRWEPAPELAARERHAFQVLAPNGGETTNKNHSFNNPTHSC